MICEIELESSPALQEAFLLSLLVNPTGEKGGFVPGDIFQEGLNRCIEPIVQRKDAEYGSWHIRHVWARNLKDIQELKSEFRSTVGLSKRSGRHKDPHEKPEFKTLLREYRNAEIHLRRPGRIIGAETPIGVETQGNKTHKNRDVDNMLKGIKSLANGGLKKWTTKTTKSRGLREGRLETSAAINEEANVDGSDSEDDMWEHDSDHDPEVSGGQLTFGIAHAKDGELVIEYEGEDDDFEESFNAI
jgi:hypothetical protein